MRIASAFRWRIGERASRPAKPGPTALDWRESADAPGPWGAQRSFKVNRAAGRASVSRSPAEIDQLVATQVLRKELRNERNI